MKNQIKIIFEFLFSKPKPIFYRGVQATDGSFRMEKKGLTALNYRPIMWCGSEDGLFEYRKIIEQFCG